MLNPSRTMRSLGQDIELCAKSLASRRLDMPDVYLWLNLDPPFDWPAQGEALRALLGDVNWVRGKYCTRLKVFLTPASLGRLQGTTQGPGFDEQIAQENLAWKIDTLYDVADDVCKIMGVAPFRQLFDPDRLGEYLGQMPSMIPMTPGAWIVLARQAGALAQQHGCMVLSDALWDEALVSFCRLHRPLRLAGGKVYAFGRELELDKSWIEVLQAIQAWNQDASRHELHPRAKDIAETINSKKPEASRRRASARSVHTAISRLRDEPQFEPVFHRHKHISLATARKHLVYLKGDDEGYYLDNMLM